MAKVDVLKDAARAVDELEAALAQRKPAGHQPAVQAFRLALPDLVDVLLASPPETRDGAKGRNILGTACRIVKNHGLKVAADSDRAFADAWLLGKAFTEAFTDVPVDRLPADLQAAVTDVMEALKPFTAECLGDRLGISPRELAEVLEKLERSWGAPGWEGGRRRR